jgi:hypothetical protein
MPTVCLRHERSNTAIISKAPLSITAGVIIDNTPGTRSIRTRRAEHPRDVDNASDRPGYRPPTPTVGSWRLA